LVSLLLLVLVVLALLYVPVPLLIVLALCILLYVAAVNGALLALIWIVGAVLCCASAAIWVYFSLLRLSTLLRGAYRWVRQR
jgi:hypothetical protein